MTESASAPTPINEAPVTNARVEGLTVDAKGAFHRPDGKFVSTEAAEVITAFAEQRHSDMLTKDGTDSGAVSTAAESSVAPAAAPEGAPAEADADAPTSVTEIMPVVKAEGASKTGDAAGSTGEQAAGEGEAEGSTWQGGPLWGGESPIDRLGRGIKKPAKGVAKHARTAGKAARRHLRESPIKDGPVGDGYGSTVLANIDERITMAAKDKINGAASKAADTARKHLRESPIKEGPIETEGPGALERLDERFTMPAKAKIRGMMGTAARKLKELRHLPTKAYVKGQTKLAEVGEFYSDEELGKRRRKITGAVIGALSLAGASYLVAKGAAVSPNGTSRHAAESAQAHVPAPTSEHGLLSTAVPEQLKLTSGSQHVHEAAQAAGAGAVAGPEVPPELAKQLHAKEIADQALTTPAGAGSAPDSLLSNPDLLGLQDYQEHAKEAVRTGTSGGAVHVHEAVQAQTGSAGTIRLQPGSDPWQVSEHQLRLQGVDHVTDAKIVDFDKRMAHMNPDVYLYNGNSSEHIPAGTELKVPKVTEE